MLLGNSLLKHGVSTPVSIVATSGSGQSANCGAAYAAPLVATITPALSGVSVSFTAPASGASGTFASTGTRTETVLTVAGVATSSAFTANTTGGAAYNVTATAGALSCNFSLTNNWTWFYYNTSLAPLAWWRMRDTSGVTVVNSGSLGSAVDLTATAWTMAQVGQLGAGEAGLTDGATTRLQCANNATLATLTAWEWIFLVNASNAGESNFGSFYRWGASSFEPFVAFGGGTGVLSAKVSNTTPSDFVTTTTTVLGFSAWRLLFAAFDNAGDRKIHIFIGASGAVSECNYLAQPALTGTYKVPTSVLNLMNNSGQSATFAGLCDEALIINGNLTPTQRSTLCTLAGV